MFLAREMTSSSFPDIGEKVGGRDHSTVIYAHNKMKKLLDEDKSLRETTEEIKNTLLHKG
jgi:chromosomal replication initiator protein